MKKILFLFFFIFSFQTFAKDIQIDGLNSFLNNVKNVSFDIKQTKYIDEIGISLESFGYGKFEKDNGLIWKITKPEYLSFIATKIYYCTDEKTEELSDLPYFQKIKNVVDEFLNGNIEPLEEIFDIQITGNNEWQINLLPNQRQLKKMFEKIEIFGNAKSISKIMIFYPNKDILTIEFQPHKEVINEAVICPI